MELPDEDEQQTVLKPPPPKKGANQTFMNTTRVQGNNRKSRVYLGDAITRWRELKRSKFLKTDANVAQFLLDSYQQQIALPQTGGEAASIPVISSSFSLAGVAALHESLEEKPVVGRNIASVAKLEKSVGDVDEDMFNRIENATIEWDDYDYLDDNETRIPEMKDVSPPLGEGDDNNNGEGNTADVDLEDSDNDEEWDTKEEDHDNDEESDPHIQLRTAGALQTAVDLDNLPQISIEESVLDSFDRTHDPVTTESEESPITDTTGVLLEEDLIGHPAAITYHNSLEQLAKFLNLPIKMCTSKETSMEQQCGATGPFEVKVKSRGTAAVIEWICPIGHCVYKWYSQPIVKNEMLAGDFFLASNILLSGNIFGKISLLFQYMNMGMVSRSRFDRIQDLYCVDSIKDLWKEKREEVIKEHQPKGPTVVLGDGRMDSSGSCAQYCTYAAMDKDSKQILYLANIGKGQTQRSSAIMKREGFVQAMDKLRHELNVTEVCTDSHSQISALFKTKYKDSGIHHSWDIWHGAKYLGSNIQQAAKEEPCAILYNWCSEIVEHFWYSIKTANGYEEFFNLWRGILHHVCGKHTWIFGACPHGPLEDGKDEEFRIVPSSTAHKRLVDIVLNRTWLRNVHKYLRFRSTDDLESVDNHILMYAPKGSSFSPPVYAARTMLAALDYNHHLHRPAKRRADGSIQYRKLYKKRSKRWTLYSLKTAKDFSYIRGLQKDILQRRLTEAGRVPKHEAGDPQEPGRLASGPVPKTEEVLQEQVS